MHHFSLALLTMLGCRPEVQFTTLYPSIGVSPDTVDFGEIAVPLTTSQTVYLANSGRVGLDWEAWIEPNDGTFAVLEEEGTIAQKGSEEITLTFTPASFLTYEAELVVVSNDPDVPELRLPLVGEGVDLPMPDIDVEPGTLEFPEVEAGGSDLQFVTLHNRGDAALQLGSVEQTGSGAFVLMSDPSNNVIGPSSSVPILISYQPTSGDGDSGSLILPSNDVDEPTVEIVLLGNGGGDYDYPDANIACPGTSEPPIYVPLDGSASVDPAGFDPLSYEWSIVTSPTGSQAELTNLVTDSTQLWTDLAGTYEVQLVVENAIGTRSAPERCTIEAVPADDLRVELIWDTPSADLDLHLARNNAAIFGGSDDCSYCRPSPNWGGADASPRLDLDDQGGYGPENINIFAPDAGEYVVRVHYFEEHQDDAVTATVKVFLEGTLAWEGSRVMLENEVWDVGQVNWPDATFGPMSVDNYDSPTRSCN